MAHSQATLNFLAANLRILLKTNFPEKKKNGWKAIGKRWQKVLVDEANDNKDKDCDGSRKRKCIEKEVECTTGMKFEIDEKNKLLDSNRTEAARLDERIEIDEKNKLLDSNRAEVARLDEKIEKLTSASTELVGKISEVVAGKFNIVAGNVMKVTEMVLKNSTDIDEMKANLMVNQPGVDEKMIEDKMVKRSKIIYATLEAKQASQLKEIKEHIDEKKIAQEVQLAVLAKLKEIHAKMDMQQIARLQQLKEYNDENLESLANHFHNLLMGMPEYNDSDDDQGNG